jgi:hypothetical protein
MTRKPGGASKDLQRRVFGTAGRRSGTVPAPSELGQVIDLVEEMLRRPIILSNAVPLKPRPGRVYDFPVRRAVEEK